MLHSLYNYRQQQMYAYYHLIKTIFTYSISFTNLPSMNKRHHNKQNRSRIARVNSVCFLKYNLRPSSLIILLMNQELDDLVKTYFEEVDPTSVSPKLKQKIQFILALIQGRKIDAGRIIDLPMKEVDRLSSMSHDNQVTLVTDMITMTLGFQPAPEPEFTSAPCYVKKEGFFSNWIQTYLQRQKRKLIFSIYLQGQKQGDLYEFPIDQIALTPGFKNTKTKFGFLLTVGEKDYHIGFQQQATCSKVFLKIEQLIQKANHSQGQRDTKSVNLQRTTPRQRQDFFKDTDISEQSLATQSYTVTIPDRKTQAIESLIKMVQQKMDVEQKFQLYKKFQNGQMLVQKTQKQEVKIILVLKCQAASEALDGFVSEAKWNSELLGETIIAKTQENGYLISKIIKPANKLFSSLQAIIERKVVYHNKKIYIVDRAVDSEEYQNQFVQTHIECIAEISQKCQGQWTLSIRGSLRTSSYLAAFSDFDKMIKYFGELQHLQKYIDSNRKGTLGSVKSLFSQKVNISPLLSENRSQKSCSARSETDQLPSEKDKNNLKMTKSSVFVFEGTRQGKLQRKFSSEISSGNVEQIDIFGSKNHEETIIKDNNGNNKKVSTNYFLQNFDSPVLDEFIEKAKSCDHEKFLIYSTANEEMVSDRSWPKFDANYPFQNNQWRLNQQKELIYINQAVLNAQKGVLSRVVKQIGTNVFSGKSIVDMSLPVEVFSGESFLQFLCQSFGYAPLYLPTAASLTDPVEQMKLVTLFLISSQSLNLKVQKPFNPILGQTFTGYLNGVPLHFEQTSHHPPISSFLMKTEQFMFYGDIHMKAGMGLNSASGINLNCLNVKFFNTGCHFKLFEPEVEVSGLIYGDRKFKTVGRAMVWEQNLHLYSEVHFGKSKNAAFQMKNLQLNGTNVNGAICRVKQTFRDSFSDVMKKEHKNKYPSVKPNQIIEKLIDIRGQFLNSIHFNNVEVKNGINDQAFKAQYSRNPLPSDSNFRLDILYRRMHLLDLSQQSKETLESIQRKDKFLRVSKKQLVN